jgi:hypothetical protein
LDLSHAGHVTVADGTGFRNRQRLTDGLTVDSGPRRLAGIREKSDVGLVNEPHVVRQPVHPLPVYGIVFFEALPYFGYLGFGCVFCTAYRLVAEETLFHCGHRGRISLCNVAMAKLTLNAHPAISRRTRVNRVRKGDWLRRGVAQTKGRIGKPGYQKDRYQKAHYNGNC